MVSKVKFIKVCFQKQVLRTLLEGALRVLSTFLALLSLRF